MEQYVSYRGVWCQVIEHGWRVKEWTSPTTGQREMVAWKKRAYIPQGPIPVGDAQDMPDDVFSPPPVDQSGTLLEEERKREASLQRSAARAKRTCRHKIKSSEFASLLTCTYRENMVDFDRVRRDWAAMLRKLQRAIPGFQAVYAFEQQSRGAWHVHAAIHKLPAWLTVPDGTGRSARMVTVRSWDYVRRLWRSVVGQDNGNVDVDGHRKTRAGRRRHYRQHESLAKLAGYVSKYLTKAYADGLSGRNRWGSTQGCGAPKAVVYDMPEMPLHELIECGFHLPPGHRIVRHFIGQYGRVWVLFSEPGEPDVPLPSKF